MVDFAFLFLVIMVSYLLTRLLIAIVGKWKL